MEVKQIPQIRVVKKTWYDNNANANNPWYEVQYYSEASEKWRSYRHYNTTRQFSDKKQAIEFALKKKAGVLHNNWITEVVA